MITDLNFEKGTVLLLLLKGDKEIIGEWGDKILFPIGWIKFKNAAHIILQDNLQKGFISVNENGNFSSDIFIQISNIIFIKEIDPKGELFKLFKDHNGKTITKQ